MISLVGDEAQLGERVAEAGAFSALLFLGLAQLLQADQLLADEQLADAVAGHRTSMNSRPLHALVRTLRYLDQGP